MLFARPRLLPGLPDCADDMSTDQAKRSGALSAGRNRNPGGGKRAGRGQITLARALSKFGISSRSQARTIVHAGRVAVNGRVVRVPDAWVDPGVDRIDLDGKPIRRRRLVYLMMNKPRGIVTTRSDERGRRTVYDLLPEGREWLFPVGRLDKDSAGLLLLTNDSRFGERLTSPRGNVAKTYSVDIDRPLDDASRRAMESGLVLPDGTRCLPVHVVTDRSNPKKFTIALKEGKNRQIRRMCETLGFAVLDLVRISVGDVKLGSLAEGFVRPLTPAELASLRPEREA
jgi:23S rRNA pseudouridine2605 synthase